MFNQSQNNVNVQVCPDNQVFNNNPHVSHFVVVVSWVNSRDRVSRQFSGGFPDVGSANVAAQQSFNRVMS